MQESKKAEGSIIYWAVFENHASWSSPCELRPSRPPPSLQQCSFAVFRRLYNGTAVWITFCAKGTDTAASSHSMAKLQEALR